MAFINGMWRSPHRRWPKRIKLRYTRQAAVSGSGKYRSVTDNSPGKYFKDASGDIHLVPNKAKRKHLKDTKRIDTKGM